MDEQPSIARAAASLRLLNELVRERASRGKVRQAVVAAQIAGLFGAYSHHGEFSNAQLEETLRTMGRALSPAAIPDHLRTAAGTAPRVLHVLTAAKAVGGDTRFVWRWIQRDTSRQYSVALTNQMYFEIPAAMRAAVTASGGAVHVLDQGGSNALDRARALRQLAAGFDVVFLHVYVEDIVPLLAFFDRKNLPPVVFVMQADHQCFAGLSVCDLVVHMRASGVRLSAARRGVLEDKMSFLPIPLEPLAARVPRAAARERLGLPTDAVVMLSIARAVKYVPIEGPSLAEATMPVIESHPHAQLIVLGPADEGPWRAARERSGGRIRALGQRSDTQSFYEAADIYIDSFPFASNTSLLEAGSYGLPLVSYFPWSDDAAVLGAGTPGFDASIMRAHDFATYERTLAQLIENPTLRAQIGARTREEITLFHSGTGWSRWLEELMQKVAATAAGGGATRAVPASQPTVLDHLLSRMYRDPIALGSAVNRFAPELGYFDRLQLLSRMLEIDRNFSFGLFLPRRLEKWVGRYLRGWRRLPGVRQLLVARFRP